MVTDTHTHLYAKEFDNDRDNLVRKAIDQGVTRFFLPNIDVESIEAMLAMEAAWPQHCFPMMGLHPCHVGPTWRSDLKTMKEWLQRRPFVAIGEIGIDLYWDKTTLADQREAFKEQIEWALAYNYPIVIHTRNSFNETMDVLSAFKTLPKGIFHCFSGTIEQAKSVLDLGGFKLGIGGVVTFKNSGLDKVVAAIDLEHLVLETDAPYLAPVPFRGKRNEPSYILEIAKKVAEIKSTTFENVSITTTSNALKLFGMAVTA